MIFLIAALILILTVACSPTKAIVKTRDRAKATITITTSNPVEVTTTPTVDVTLSK